MYSSVYLNQAALLVHVLPFIANEKQFALKGGTAINLFHRNMPRLSVDIDLVYLPKSGRRSSLNAIRNSFARIEQTINEESGLRASKMDLGHDHLTRIHASNDMAEITIETSTDLTGTMLPCRPMMICSAAEKFGYVEVNIVSFEDLFAGKIVATIDRQSPRDLFDVKGLYDNEGLSEGLLRALMVYVASSERPMYELLLLRPKKIEHLFERDLVGMTRENVTLKELDDVRWQLFADIRKSLSSDFAKFLISIHNAEPDFGCLGFPDEITANLASLPAIGRKISNLQTLRRTRPGKHRRQLEMLQKLFR